MASYAVSDSYFRSEHMSPPALAAAVLLHALVAAALWWLSAHRPPVPQEQEPVQITLEQIKPEPKPEPPPQPPKPEPPQVKQEQPMPLPFEGLKPPAELEAEKATQVPTPEINKALPPAPPQTAAIPEPKASPPPAASAPEPPKPAPPKPEPQKAVPPPQAPHGIAVPPANPLPRPALAPSPLSRPQPSQQRQSATTKGPDQPAPSPFVNPADARNHARAQDNYLWQVVARLRGYKYHANVTVSQAVTVVRIVIARDGRLLSAEIIDSSGQPEMDRGVLAGVRQGSPYAPLPDNIPGASATFRLPLVSTVER